MASVTYRRGFGTETTLSRLSWPVRYAPAMDDRTTRNVASGSDALDKVAPGAAAPPTAAPGPRTDRTRIRRHADTVAKWVAAQRRAIHDGAVDDYPHLVPYRLLEVDLDQLLELARPDAEAEKDAALKGTGW